MCFTGAHTFSLMLVLESRSNACLPSPWHLILNSFMGDQQLNKSSRNPASELQRPTWPEFQAFGFISPSFHLIPPSACLLNLYIYFTAIKNPVYFMPPWNRMEDPTLANQGSQQQDGHEALHYMNMYWFILDISILSISDFFGFFDRRLNILFGIWGTCLFGCSIRD